MLDKQAVETMRPFEGPIPGQSLTNSPEGQQPYEGAPEYTGVRDASEAIWLSLLEKENLYNVANLMAQGTPISDITKMLLMSGLSQGKFNPDLMLLLVEPVMYMLLAIAEKIGIRNVKIDKDDDITNEDFLDEEDNTMLLMESKREQAEIRNPERFSDLKANIAPDQIPQELISKLENIDVQDIQQSLMSKPEQPQAMEESLMSRR